jgi:hypothetical protein
MKTYPGFDPARIKNKLKVIKIEPDISYLTSNQKEVLKYLIECAKILDDIYLLQKNPESLKLKREIEQSGNIKLLNYFNVMAGPFDQFEENIPFIEGCKFPEKGGFYPEDITLEEFDEFIKNNPDVEEDFISPYTIVVRENKKLKAIPYSEYYKEYLTKASEFLDEACNFSENPTVKEYLAEMSNAFLTNNFYDADIKWLKMENHDIDSLLGPQEFYEDIFLGHKAAFTSFICIKNKEEVKKLSVILNILEILQQNLPIPEHYKKLKRGSSSQIQIVNLIFNSGDARGPIQAAAFNLPNSQKIRANFGSKKILIHNIMEAKFNSITLEIVDKLLSEKDKGKVTFSAYFNLILMHEISHELGIGFVEGSDGELHEVTYFLKDLYNIIEEAKADIMAIYSLMTMVKECYISDCTIVEVTTTYLISIFRAMRFGSENAHGVANIIQWDFLYKEGVIVSSKENQKLSIDFIKFDKAIENLLAIILTLQGEGDYEKLKNFIEEYSPVDEELAFYLKKLDDLPIDILPYFPIAGEIEPIF